MTLAAPLWQVPGVPLTRHALNRVFTWEAHDGPFRRITRAQAAAYSVREASIVQLAPDGARVVRDDGCTEQANAPDRQFPILCEGRTLSE